MFSDTFIERPKFAMVISLFLLIAGAIFLFRLPVAEYSEVAPPQIHVETVYDGASAATVAESVALPLETELNGVDNLLYFSSTCDDLGIYECMVTFKPGTNPDMNLVNVQNAVRRAEPQLPTDVVRGGIDCSKRTGAPLATFAFRTDGRAMSMIRLYSYVGTFVKDNLARVDGVSYAGVQEAQKCAMRIWLDPVRLAGLGLSTGDIVAAVQAQNVPGSVGNVGGEGASRYLEVRLGAAGRLRTAEEFGAIVVRRDTDGSLVHLRDVARVEFGAQNYQEAAQVDGQDCVVLEIYRDSDANAVATVARVKETLARLAAGFPAGVTWQVHSDPTAYIRMTMREIAVTLLCAILLVVAITYLFLQDIRATVVPAVAIPVALFGTFPVIYALGYSINTFTMFGLVLVIGSLVDDAIVVVENYQTQLERDAAVAPQDAARRCMREITGAVIATTFVTVACYLPLAFVTGMVGGIYRQFVVTMCVALVLSAVVALTLSPALCALLLRPRAPGARNLLARGVGRALEAGRGFYLRGAGLLVRHGLAALLLFGAVVAVAAWLAGRVPGSFLPDEDKGEVLVNIELPPLASLARTQASVDEMRRRCQAIPGVESCLAIAGFSYLSGDGENCGLVNCRLAPWSKRRSPDQSVASILAKITAAGHTLPDAEVACFLPPAIEDLGTMGGVTYDICAEGDPAPAELQQVAEHHAVEIAASPAALSDDSGYSADTPVLRLDIDRDKAEALGLDAAAIYSSLQGQLAGYYVNDFNRFGDTFQVKVQDARAFRTTAESLAALHMTNADGDEVPFSSFASTRYACVPRVIPRFNKMAAVEFEAQTKPGVPTGTLMKEIENAKLPSGYHVEWTGLSYQEKRNEGQLLPLVLLAALFAYLFLVAQYESWTMPVAVMLTAVFAVAGGLAGLLLAGEPLSIYAQLGLVMLLGLTAKSAVLIVEFAKKERDAGRDPAAAAMVAAARRYRAVMMTALSFVFGVLPLVFATGAGSGSRRAIGITTFSGMIAATFVGVAFTPALYVLVARLRGRFARPRHPLDGADGE